MKPVSTYRDCYNAAIFLHATFAPDFVIFPDQPRGCVLSYGGGTVYQNYPEHGRRHKRVRQICLSKGTS